MRFCELYEANTTGFEIYCDMDGVLVDFVGGVQKAMSDPQHDMTKKEHRNNFWKFLQMIPKEEAIAIWANFDWAPGGQELWKYISHFNPAILSAPGISSREIIEAGKIQWIKKNLNPKPSNIILSRNKGKHANQFGILIDDMKKNTDDWEANGGVGILYDTGNYNCLLYTSPSPRD